MNVLSARRPQPITCSEQKYWNREQQDGAVDYAECPSNGRRCRCGHCAVCGYAKHSAIHGPLLGAAPGSKPYGHRFEQAYSKWPRIRAGGVRPGAVPPEAGKA